MIFSLLMRVASADWSEAGRFEISSLSDQSLFELLINDLKPEFTGAFRDSDGNYKDVGEILHLTVDPVGEIQKLDLSSFRSYGTLNMEYLPHKLKSVDLCFLLVEGEFIAGLIPRFTKIFFCGDNKLTGNVKIKDLSDSLVVLSLFHNSLSGTLNFQHLPKNLLVFDVAKNNLCGRLDFHGLDKPVESDDGGMYAAELWQDRPVDISKFYLDLEGNNFDLEVSVKEVDLFQDWMVFHEDKVLVDVHGNTKKLLLVNV